MPLPPNCNREKAQPFKFLWVYRISLSPSVQDFFSPQLPDSCRMRGRRGVTRYPGINDQHMKVSLPFLIAALLSEVASMPWEIWVARQTVPATSWQNRTDVLVSYPSALVRVPCCRACRSTWQRTWKAAVNSEMHTGKMASWANLKGTSLHSGSFC